MAAVVRKIPRAGAGQAAFLLPVAGLVPVPLDEANRLIAEWDNHDLGPVKRPFGAEAWVLEVCSRPVSVAVSASTVSAVVRGEGAYADVVLKRGEVVELARLCTAPGQRWATRVMIRLWREVAAQRWPYWHPAAAVSYSQNGKHDGQVYRFDGWTRIATRKGRSGGGGSGSWGKPVRAGDETYGAKSLWMWRYGDE
jgi:hypothetical protein